MEPLVATVLLGLAWRDALDRDSELDHLDGQGRQSEVALRNDPGLPIVDAHGRGGAKRAERAHERPPHRVAELLFMRVAAEQEPAEHVRDGEQVAAAAIANAQT